jgi:hypothetical protein
MKIIFKKSKTKKRDIPGSAKEAQYPEGMYRLRGMEVV